MDRPELRLVTDAAAAPRRRLWPAACGAAVLAAAVLATLAGADRARAPIDAASLAESALAASLAGHDAAPAREASATLRRALEGNPLDAATRIVAASLDVESGGEEARREAVRQTLAAVRSVPTDEWVSRAAARVLARCGETSEALRQIAGIFAYAPDYAALALADIEPFVPPDALEQGIPGNPKAWLAWSERLRMAGREAEADARLAALRQRWPEDLPALRAAAGLAAARERVDELVRLIPPSMALADTPEAASLHAFRARSKAAGGDLAGARDDARRAVDLARGDPWIEALAGDAIAAVDPPLAREYWNRALYRLAGAPATREATRFIRSRLARLDEREGRAGDALRSWRGILAEHPDDAEARRHVAALNGQ